MRRVVKLLALLVVIASGMNRLPAQVITRFFVMPDTSAAAPGSDSMFAGTEASIGYAYDFAEDIRYDRGGFVTLSQDSGNPSVWNVVDFRLQATDCALGSQLDFTRPSAPGVFGTFTSSSANGFPDFSTVSVSITGDLTATGPLSGLFPASPTLTMTGTVVPGYFHSVIQFTGALGGVGGTFSLFMKGDFFPPTINWDMIVLSASSFAQAPGNPSLSGVVGSFSLQRGLVDPSTYDVMNLAMLVQSNPPIIITGPPSQSAGVLAFDSGVRGITGTLNVLVDGVPCTIPIDGAGESFVGSVLRPTAMVLDESSFGPLTSLHLDLATCQLVPPDPPMNDFQIGLTTTLVMRGRPGDAFGVAASFSATPGINVGCGDVPISMDDLFWISIDPAQPYFANNLGYMPATGEVLITISLPNDPGLIGATFFLGGGTYDQPTFTFHAVTNSHRGIVK